MCGYFGIGFIDFMFAGKTLIDFTTIMDKIMRQTLVIMRNSALRDNFNFYFSAGFC